MHKQVKVYVTKGDMEIGENIQSSILAFAFSLSYQVAFSNTRYFQEGGESSHPPPS
jgi:hypothetical protein